MIKRENSDDDDDGEIWSEEKVMVARDITTLCEASVMRRRSTMV